MTVLFYFTFYILEILIRNLWKWTLD